MITHLLIGLGNPGKSYAENRHNVGFMAIDMIRAEYGFGKESSKHGGLLSEGIIDGFKTYAFKPQSYMNFSGEPAQRVVSFFKIPLEHIAVFHDELDLAFAKIRIKRGGGNGGHNGLKSLDAHLGIDYQRVRIGIGHPGDKDRVSDYVLSDFSKDEKKTMDTLLKKIAEKTHFILANDSQKLLNALGMAAELNTKIEIKP